ncbi:MAG: TonB-dependent receptor [Melioribacteraceae bacterium]|nr:MAG: TonB-dependent receptor [Melioribacteraceae bacterium]
MRVVLFLLLFPILLFSQQYEVKGRVTNLSGEPLELVNVVINSIGTATNHQGNFTFQQDKPFTGTIKFSHLGYKSVVLTIEEYNQLSEKVIRMESEIISSQTVLVEATLGQEGITPMTFSKIENEEIRKTYVNQDIPEFLSTLPSTTFYSEGGAGLGYNYLSIRGFDQRRLSISVNGIPQNDPEDHNLYWLDMPDLLSSTGIIQVQRGAGSGVTGYPAIGGSINIITSPFSDKPRLKFGSMIGSYNTRKYSASFSSGLVDKKYSFYARISQTLSSGYRDYNWVDFKSYHFSAVRYDENLTTQINLFGGPVADGLVYTGLPKSHIENRDLRKKNYSYWSGEGTNFFSVDRRPEEKENFSQPHYELLNEYRLNENVKINSALFLIIGKGFFDYDGSWAPYSYFRLTPSNGFAISGDPDNLYMSNVLIRAMVENKQYGWIPRVNIQHKNGNLILGGEIRVHNSVHWGSINYAEGIPSGVPVDYRYYYYEGGKDIFTLYAHEEYQLNEQVNILAEIQLAHHNYKIENEKYLNNEFSLSNTFFNPRFGINYKFDDNVSSYFALATVTREPRLKNYYDAAESGGGADPQFNKNSDGTYNFDDPIVSPETMNSFELGASYSSELLSSNLNMFFMSFDDEIVKNGQLDRFGQPVTGNVERTIHSGIELSASVKPTSTLEFIVNGSYSNNYIKEGKTFVGYDSGVADINLADNKIAGFPDITLNAIAKFTYSGFYSQIALRYVGSYYTDNYDEKLGVLNNLYPGLTSYTDNKVEAYTTANFFASYSFELKPVFREVKVYCRLVNLFDELYAAYGVGGDFFPGPERHFNAGIEVGL